MFVHTGEIQLNCSVCGKGLCYHSSVCITQKILHTVFSLQRSAFAVCTMHKCGILKEKKTVLLYCTLFVYSKFGYFEGYYYTIKILSNPSLLFLDFFPVITKQVCRLMTQLFLLNRKHNRNRNIVHLIANRTFSPNRAALIIIMFLVSR